MKDPSPRPTRVGFILRGDGFSTDVYRVSNVAQSCSSAVETDVEPPDDSVVKTFIVEDSPIILDNLVATLEEMAPVQVVGSAPDEVTAVERLAAMNSDVDLVIIDIFLKSGSGLGVLRGVAKSGLGAKRVVLTNYATADMREKCKSLGAHRVFDKSTDLDDLIAYCTRLADGGSETTSGAIG